MFSYGKAICYSGFRDGQSPDHGIFPSREEIREDLLILHGRWKYLRLYDCDPHAEHVLDVIRTEKLDFQVMLGAYIAAEVNNPECPWGGDHAEEVLQENRQNNLQRIDRMIELANAYPNEVFALSVGNEATVEWTDHLVPVERVVEFVHRVKANAKQPVTFCENYAPWLGKLEPLAEAVDFISIHTYPVWEYKGIDQGMSFTIQNYEAVVNANPGIPVIITEAGWTTNSNGRGIDRHNAGEELQDRYCRALQQWSEDNNVLTFIFEAFDEYWKGSPEPLEPEKHWGIYRSDRSPKLVVQAGL